MTPNGWLNSILHVMSTLNIKHWLLIFLLLLGAIFSWLWWDASQPTKGFPQLGTVIKDKDPQAPLVTIKSDKNQLAIEKQELLASALRQLPAVKQLSKKDKNTLIQQLIQKKLMLLEAKKHQIEQRLSVKQAIESILLQAYQRNILDNELSTLAITEEDLRKYYQQNEAQFTHPEMVRVSIIQIKHNPKASKQQLAKKLQQELVQSPEKFEQAVQTHSDDYRSRQKNGKLPWMVKGQAPLYWTDKIMHAAFKLSKENPISPLIQLKDASAILKWHQSRPSHQIPFVQAKNTIKQNILQQKRNEWMDQYWAKLEKEYQIEINAHQVANTNFEVRLDSQTPPRSPQ